MSEAKDTSPGSSNPQRAAAMEPSALRQIRESAPALRDEGKVEEAFEFFLSALEAVLHQTRELELLVAKRRREGVGKRSERIDPGQLQRLFEALCSQTSEAAPTAAIDPQAEAREDAAWDEGIKEAEQARRPEKSRPQGPGRLRTGTLPRQVHHHEVPESERMCTPCGVAKERIGEGCDAHPGVCPGALRRARTPPPQVCLREVQGVGDDGAGAGQDHRAQPGRGLSSGPCGGQQNRGPLPASPAPQDLRA